MKRILTAIALAAVGLAANAQVTVTAPAPAPLTITGFDAPGLPAFTTVLRNAGITTTAGTITATFLGKEALDTDTFAFTLGGITLFNTGAVGATSSTAVPAGALGFSFLDMTTGNLSASYGVLGSVVGGAFVPYTTAAYQLVLGFNDGLNVDGDYDDMVVGLSVTAVPEPETYALLLAGLGAVGFIARRRQKDVQA